MENLKKHKGATGLHRAASKGNLKMVDLLVVYYKANVNMPDSEGNTPL
jgi:ankyrin repeat protein